MSRAAAGPTLDLASLAAQATAAGRLGLDTEFMSEGRYRALLCLVGLATDAGTGPPRVELVDALDPRLDSAPLAEVLADPAVAIVVHAGRQDVAILRRTWATDVRNVFDTQVAAGFAGFGAQTGYGPLLADVLGLRLAKSASFTRWDVRPLTAEQLRYARDDVVHLLPLADALAGRLRASGRLAWARQECRRLEDATDERDPDTAYLRLPRVGQLSPVTRAVARELAAWRERTAAAADRPVGAVLGDPALIEVVRRRPATPAALDRVRGIPPAALRRRGGEILAAVERGLAAEPVPAGEVEQADTLPTDVPAIALCEAVARARALDAGLAYELVASRNDLARIVAAVRRRRPEPPVRTLEGWRRTLVGAELLDLLSGRRAVTVGPSGRLEITGPGG